MLAVSQNPDWDGLDSLYSGGNWLNTAEGGLIADDIWAGGDDRGPGIATLAISQGRQAAEAIHANLRGEPASQQDTRSVVTTNLVKPELYASRARTSSMHGPTADSLEIPDREVCKTINEDEFISESGRCLSCGMCIGCQQCWMYCNASAFLNVDKVQPGSYFSLNLDRCEGCGKCIEICPTGFRSPREESVH